MKTRIGGDGCFLFPETESDQIYLRHIKEGLTLSGFAYEIKFESWGEILYLNLKLSPQEPKGEKKNL